MKGSSGNRRRVWRVAIYIRLSREDARCLEESESVANQRALLTAHLASLQDGDDYLLTDEYVDDGVSGTTDDERGGFQRMLSDIRRGRVNCVLVKDLARSFRNYSDQGYYLDDWFPRHNVRFISLFHQPLDSYRDPRALRNIAVPIQGVLNENHCAETSEKVREVFDWKRRSGAHIGSFAVYGYRKDPENKNALVVDPEAAAVVQEIFRSFLRGVSLNAIVRSLNDRGVLCPAVDKRERLGLSYQNPSVNPDRRPLWCAGTVRTILKNRMYCGDMVQGRYRIKSYKVHVQEAVPPEEWYVVENTHEAIIDRDAFAAAQRLLQRDVRTGSAQQQPHLFGGFLRCGDCGRAMSRSKAGRQVYYYCRTYKDQSKSACSRHSIRHDRLEAAVLWALRLQVYLGADAEQILPALWQGRPASEAGHSLRRAVDQARRELARIRRHQKALYPDWKDGALSRDEYHQLKETYERRAQTLERSLETLSVQLTNLEEADTAFPSA